MRRRCFLRRAIEIGTFPDETVMIQRVGSFQFRTQVPPCKASDAAPPGHLRRLPRCKRSK